MNLSGNEQKINNINSNFSNETNNNTYINNIQLKCDNLFNSYEILKMILYPNLTKEKNNFMDIVIDMIKSQIIVFINMINENNSRKIFEIINNNNQNLSKQITLLYDLINSTLPSNEFSVKNKNEINKNDNLNSIVNNNQKNFPSNEDNNNFIGNTNNKNGLKNLINKNNENPIKINLEIKKNCVNNKILPLELSTHISSYTSTNTKIKNNFFNLQTYTSKDENDEKKINSYSTMKNLHNNVLFLSEKKKLKNKINNVNNSPHFSNSISNKYKKELKRNFSYINNSNNSNNNSKIIRSNNKNRCTKYQNIESKVALYLKREDEFNRKNNYLLYKKRISPIKKYNKNINDIIETQSIYQLLPNSLKEPMDDFIKKQQDLIFDKRNQVTNELNCK